MHNRRFGARGMRRRNNGGAESASGFAAPVT